MQNLVIVESPAKASTIEKILGKDYKVVSSYGHIRDLSKKNMGIDIENNFTPSYEVSADKKSVLKNLISASKKCDVVWLATDEDREGEAIAWHLYDAMSLSKKVVNRIVFNEITKSAIQSAVENPRNINTNLVNAQQARRVLDRIVGFKLSPVLWKKVKSGLSAGRVQSVAVRLIVEREKSISSFKLNSEFSILARLITKDKSEFVATSTKTVDNFQNSRALLESLINSSFSVNSIETKPSKSSPSAPFTTSSLQQVASNRLGFSVTRTMTVAQKLYESGHITYMRTDSTNLSVEAVKKIENFITEKYGESYLKTRNYSTKAKVAQEAHEAIRPTSFETINAGVDDSQKKLYKLIWERTICSQMSDAIFDKTVVKISNTNNHEVKFQSKGQVIKFDGFLSLQKSLSSVTNKDIILPKFKVGDILNYKSIKAKEKFLKPPGRYTEASLVKKMEELGIGRPSTYAPTISVIQKREYVIKDDVDGKKVKSNTLVLIGDRIEEIDSIEVIGSEKKKLIPSEVGKITNEFLVSNFTDIMDYNFTAKVEDEFDNIASGKKPWKSVIEVFYNRFDPKVNHVNETSEKVTGQRDLGIDPKSRRKVLVRLGKYGPIVQLGENDDGSNEKPRYAKLRKGQTIELISFDDAIDLFNLPREIGFFESEKVIVSEGRYGPYIKFGSKFISLKDKDPFTVNLDECIDVIKSFQEFEKKKIINTFDYKNEKIEILNGRYGPYIKYVGKNFKIPKNIQPSEISFEDCLKIISKSFKK